MEIIKMENVTKDYPMGTGKVRALRNINLTIKKGELSTHQQKARY
jgi:ABC-type lipoprotein export system ATPase subunit